MRKLIGLFCIILLLTSCKSKKRIVTTKKNKTHQTTKHKVHRTTKPKKKYKTYKCHQFIC